MIGFLIYQADDLQRNTWFAQRLCEESAHHDIELLTVTVGQLLPSVRPDFVINRSRDTAISQSYEAEGIRCFNNADITRITNDKWLTYQYLQQRGIPTAPTMLCTQNCQPPQTYPVVIKPCDGHGGVGVRLVHTPEQYEMTKSALPDRFLMQQPMRFGWDLRVYVLGGQPYASMLRTSADDFRSNFSLGGNAQSCEPDDALLALVGQVSAALSPDFVGIDILRHPEGGYVIGEIEDAVGCRMLYQLTQKDPAADYMAYIAEQMGL